MSRTHSGEERLAELALLQDGWHTLGNPAPSKSAFTAMRTLLALIAEANISEPYLYPTYEGGLLAEWDGDWATSIDCFADGNNVYLHDINLKTNFEISCSAFISGRKSMDALIRVLVSVKP